MFETIEKMPRVQFKSLYKTLFVFFFKKGVELNLDRILVNFNL